MWGLTDYLYTPERYTINSLSIEIREKISEGGYAYVHKAIDLSTSQEYAVKKILCQSPELLQMAEREIAVMRSLPIHDNIVRYYDSLITTQNSTPLVLIVMELCTGGTLVNLLEKYNGALSFAQINYILKEICQGVSAVHSAGFIHRDLKIENILLHNKKFKLCDFGSCSNETYDLTSLSRIELLGLQEKFERETTLMYRPPEMIDLYQRGKVDFKGDAWMIGCIVYTLAFCKHPFQDQTQLAIVNGHYNFPQNSRFDDKFHGFISWILNPNPTERPSVQQILTGINDYDQIPGFASVTGKTPKRVNKRIDRDLTQEEIEREMQLIREQMEGKAARNAGVPVEGAKKKDEFNIWQAPVEQSAPKPQGNQNIGWAKF